MARKAPKKPVTQEFLSKFIGGQLKRLKTNFDNDIQGDIASIRLESQSRCIVGFAQLARWDNREKEWFFAYEKALVIEAVEFNPESSFSSGGTFCLTAHPFPVYLIELQHRYRFGNNGTSEILNFNTVKHHKDRPVRT